ncbi:MAG: PepSY domain-containing protein, partial [Oxalobacteraceae bacterium]
MNETLRQSMAWLHTYLGLFFGWILFGVLLTGSIAVFYAEINLWAAPEVQLPAKLDRSHSISLGRDYLEEHAPDARQWRIVIPTERDPVLRVIWKDLEGESTTHRLEAQSGKRIASDMDAGAFYLRYHYTLGISRSDSLIGFLIVGAAGLAMMAAIVSGIIIHKRIFRDFFNFRPHGSRQRAWMDAHNVLSVLPLPFHAMMAFTGLVILYYAYIPAGVDMLNNGDTSAYQRDSAMSEYIDVDTPPGVSGATVDLLPLVRRAQLEWGGAPALNIYISNPNRRNSVVEVWSQRDHRVAHFPSRVSFDGSSGRTLRV